MGRKEDVGERKERLDRQRLSESWIVDQVKRGKLIGSWLGSLSSFNLPTVPSMSPN